MTIFALLQGAVLGALWAIYLRTGSPLGLMVWVMGMAAALFGNFFETPYNSAPFWFLVGIILAPLVQDELAVVMTDRRVAPGDPLRDELSNRTAASELAADGPVAERPIDVDSVR